MTLFFSARHRFAAFTLDAEFEAGEGVTALFGPSGSGKTTINNIIAGLIRADEAKIVLDGAILNDTLTGRFVPPNRRGIGYVFQEGRLFPHLSVRSNLLYGAPDDSGLRKITSLLGLEALLARYPGNLSGGERQRTALGRALLSSPRLLLLDEPFAAVDAARKDEVLPYLRAMIAETRIPVLYISHAREEVAAFARRVVLIGGGRAAPAAPVSEFAAA